MRFLGRLSAPPPGMHRFLKTHLIFLISIGSLPLSAISLEERKILLDQKSRGLINQVSAGASPSSSSAPPSQPTSTDTSKASSSFSFTEMNDNFKKSITDMTENFNKSLPPVTEDSNGLQDLTAASARLITSESGADSFSSQIVDSIVASMNQLAQLQILYERQAFLRNLQLSQTELKNKPSLPPATPKAPPVVSSSSEVTLSGKSKLRGLSSPALDALNAKAYHPSN